MDSRLGLLAGKRGIVFGIANTYSLGWFIAKKAAEHGAELALTFINEKMKKRVDPLAESLKIEKVLPCDVTQDGAIKSVFDSVANDWASIDFVVHSVAFSQEELRGTYVKTTRENFLKTLDISCYSFTEIAREAAAYMPKGGSLLTLSYLGAEKVVPNYNVMGVAKAALEASVRYLAVDLGGQGIRVNAISAGTVKTLAASGIGGFYKLHRWAEENAPLQRSISGEDVGNAGLFLLSDLANNVSGEILHVDAGYHVMGMKHAALFEKGEE